MTWTRVGVILGVLAFGCICFLATIADSPVSVPLIAFGALVLLVAGGNWLNSYLGIERKPQQFNRPDRSAPASDPSPAPTGEPEGEEP